MYRKVAFTLTEILVVAGVLTFLAGFLFVIAGPARESARQARCISNLKQIFQALQMYASDSDAESLYPELRGISYMWTQEAKSAYIKTRDILFCPTGLDKWRKTFGSTYIVPIFFSPVEKDGSVSVSRRLMIQKEKKFGARTAIIYCTIHDELIYAPGERGVAPEIASPFRIELRLDGSVWKGRRNSRRELPFTGNGV